MRPLYRFSALVFVIALAATSFLRAQDGPEPSDAEKAFFREFKRAVLASDQAWVASHTCFPVRALVEGRVRMIANAEELAAIYPRIMTLDVVNAIRRQTAESLVRTRQGVMIADGEVWIGEDPATPAGKPPAICVLAFGNSG